MKWETPMIDANRYYELANVPPPEGHYAQAVQNVIDSINAKIDLARRETRHHASNGNWEAAKYWAEYLDQSESDLEVFRENFC